MKQKLCSQCRRHRKGHGCGIWSKRTSILPDGTIESCTEFATSNGNKELAEKNDEICRKINEDEERSEEEYEKRNHQAH